MGTVVRAVNTIHFPQLKLLATGTGGIESNYQVPNFGLNLDIGRCPTGAERWPRLFLTHGHIDHAAGLPYYVSLRRLLRMPPPEVFCPARIRPDIENLLAAWRRLDSDAEACTLHGLRPGDTVPIGKGRFVRTFASPHRVVSLGYTVMQTKKRLRPSYRGLGTGDIADLVRGGETVDEVIEVPELCFPGDTRIEVVERVPEVRRARILILECTFLGDAPTAAYAAAGGHIHLDQIAERADLFENEHIVLTHFSRRYSHARIDAAIQSLPRRLRDRIKLIYPTSPRSTDSARPA